VFKGRIIVYRLLIIV